MVGAFTHDVSFGGFVRDLVIFEGAWFALWRLPLPVRWLGGVTLAVGVRAAFVGRFSLSFYLVALAFTALFVLLGRALLRYRH